MCVYLDKPKRLSHQISMNESDGEDDMNITEKLRHASSSSPANIPMLVVVSFNPDTKGLQKKQIEIQRGIIPSFRKTEHRTVVINKIFIYIRYSCKRTISCK